MLGDLINEILSKSEKIEDKIIKYRRKLHKHPELGLSEHETSRFIIDELNNLGLKVEKDLYTRDDIKRELDELGEQIAEDHGPTGVVGILEGENEGKTVLLRSDMDALVVTESNNPDHIPAKEGFRSEKEGIMHACGHDSHIAMLLGAAEILSGMRDKIKGKIKFLFQPDEERGCGAKLMCKAGVLEDVDAVYGIHVWSPIKSGEVMINRGPMMASVDNFWMEVKGGGGHSSMPHETSDPLLAANEMLSLIYKMNARGIDTRDPSLVSVEMMHSKADWGVIPNRAEMRGTIRTFDKKVRKEIISKIKNIGKSIAELYGLEFKFNNLYAFPPTINTENEADIARKSAGLIFGEEKVITGKPVMSGEDFAYYLEEVPGAFIFLGIRDESKGTDHPHHNPDFDVDESMLSRGAALHAAIALNYLNESS